MFESYDKKLVVFMFYGRFYELLLTFLGSKAILMARKTRYMFESYDQKIRFLAVLWPFFMSYCPRFWVSWGICMARKTQYLS